jgi:MoaA/NifB/PqqE/SkfB family radical SAM enzyme
MCYTWKHQSKKEDEIRPEDLITLPRMVRLNITGGEPFLKEDLSEILDVVKRKAKRVVISSNGFLTKRTLDVMSKHRDVGIRISVDGIEETHDHIRGVKGAYQKTLETLQGLRSLGVKDLGIAVTVSDQNAKDLVALHKLAKENCVELATAILHNAYYFHKEDNIIIDKYQVELGLKALIVEFLKSQHPKDWFRAYFTQGIIDHMNGKQRALKCTMAKDSFYVDPYGNVRPCNVMDFSFGNIKDETFQEIWTSPDAEEARERVGACTYNCWMIGSVGHLMRQNFWVPLFWIIKHKWAWQKTTVCI